MKQWRLKFITKTNTNSGFKDKNQQNWIEVADLNKQLSVWHLIMPSHKISSAFKFTRIFHLSALY